MTAETARAVLLAQKGDRDAMEKLLRENAALTAAIARRFLSRGEWDELIQLASIGFYKAVMTFQPGLGWELSTYAVPKMAGEIRAFLRQDGAVHIGRALRARAFAVRREMERLERETGESPRLSALCAATGLSADEVTEALEAPFSVASLEEQFSSGEGSLGDLLTEGSPEEGIAWRLDVRQALEELEPRLRAVVALRYLRELTQQQTARRLGVTQAHVSRMEKRALAALREKLEQ